MESQAQNPEFRIKPENFHPCISGSTVFAKTNIIFRERHAIFLLIITCDTP